MTETADTNTPNRDPRAAQRQEMVALLAVLAVIGAYIAMGLRTASTTLGCDFLAYDRAAGRWLAGQPIYDLAASSSGSCGLYQYPPPFVLVAAPFSLLGFEPGTWAWIAFLLGCWALGTAILPVGRLTRWAVLLLGAIGWPLIFGVRIGQVGPILYLVFAVAWRYLDRPIPLGASIAVGTMVKLQPALLLVWLAARRAWTAIVAAVAVGVAIVLVAAVLGLGDWIGLASVLRAVSNALALPANVSIGARLVGLGVDPGVAGLVQLANVIVLVAVVVFAGLRLPATPGFLVAVVASQLISPIVWTHYALVLMLPVAWLLDRRQWWAMVIPIVEAWILLPFTPIWSDTIVFYATLAAVLVVGWSARHEPDAAAVAPSAAAPVRA
jgi:alpha-1,2-mannosyltransferase